MKQYKHPKLGREVNYFKTEFAEGYKICDTNGLLVFGDERMTKENILALGFEEVVEEKKQDWKLDLYESLEGLFGKGLDELEEFLAFRKKLEKHMPKQKKLSKSEVAVYCNRTGNRVLEDCMIFFLRDHDLLEE